MFDEEERYKADLWLVNSCTVKSPSQSQMATVLADAKVHSIGVVVSGCVPQGDKHSPDLQVPLRRHRSARC
jgi:threonylcarbamoyladenosine tRNA methylthiotransferase CDKAL1